MHTFCVAFPFQVYTRAAVQYHRPGSHCFSVFLSSGLLLLWPRPLLPVLLLLPGRQVVAEHAGHVHALPRHGLRHLLPHAVSHRVRGRQGERESLVLPQGTQTPLHRVTHGRHHGMHTHTDTHISVNIQIMHTIIIQINVITKNN